MRRGEGRGRGREGRAMEGKREIEREGERRGFRRPPWTPGSPCLMGFCDTSAVTYQRRQVKFTRAHAANGTTGNPRQFMGTNCISLLF